MHSEAERLSIADLLAALGDRSFGAVLLALALPATVMPPLASAVIGAPVMIVSFQLLLRRGGPRLPEGLARLSIDRRGAGPTLGRTVNLALRLESALRPRLAGLSGPFHTRLVALCCVFLSTVLMLPTPVAHTAAGLGLGAFAAGLIHRDGLALLAGWALAICCGLILALITIGVIVGLRHL